MKGFISKAVDRGFGSVFMFITALSAVWIFVRCLSFSRLSVLLILPFAAAVFFIVKGILAFERRLEKKCGGEKCADRLFLKLLGALIIMQCAVALTVDLEPKNDLRYICTAAKNLVLFGAERLHDGLPQMHENYFAVYPNNHLLLVIVSGLYKAQYLLFGRISNILPTAVNIIGLDISYILMYICARLMYAPEKAAVCAVRGLMFTPLVTYSLFFYTDSMAMPWITAAFLLYVILRKRFTEKAVTKGEILKRASLIAAVGAAAAVAYKIKGSALLLVPAVVIDILLRCKGIKEKLAAAQLVIVFAAVCALVGNTTCGVLKISDEELYKYSFPPIHWVMMSADGRGGYQSEDFFYTKSVEGYKNKERADIARLEDKLERQGVFGTVKHLANKLGYTWGNGTFMAGYYMENSVIFNSPVFYFLSTVLHFSLMILMARSFIGRSGAGGVLEENFVLKLLIMELTLFLLLWETRNRYLVSFFILFALI
ncbi:MAG: hypothetical protein ACI4JW_01770 [Oscillospiraceae bacterium]